MIIMRIGRLGARGSPPCFFIRGAVCNEPVKMSEPVLYLSFSVCNTFTRNDVAGYDTDAIVYPQFSPIMNTIIVRFFCSARIFYMNVDYLTNHWRDRAEKVVRRYSSLSTCVPKWVYFRLSNFYNVHTCLGPPTSSLLLLLLLLWNNFSFSLLDGFWCSLNVKFIVKFLV